MRLGPGYPMIVIVILLKRAIVGLTFHKVSHFMTHYIFYMYPKLLHLLTLVLALS